MKRNIAKKLRKSKRKIDKRTKRVNWNITGDLKIPLNGRHENAGFFS